MGDPDCFRGSLVHVDFSHNRAFLNWSHDLSNISVQRGIVEPQKRYASFFAFWFASVPHGRVQVVLGLDVRWDSFSIRALLCQPVNLAALSGGIGFVGLQGARVVEFWTYTEQI